MNLSKAVIFPAILGLACLGAAQSGQQTTPPASSPEQEQTNPPPSQAPPTQNPAENPPEQANPQTPAPAPAPPPAHFGPVIVVDAEHGGPDNGARGSSGAIEKDVVLRFAQQLRAELQAQGYRVVMTRTDDSDPSYDDRDAAANVYRDMVFVSLHVSTTGKQGTARTYYYSFWSPAGTGTQTTGGAGESPLAATPAAAPPGWISWEEAQRGFGDASHRLADSLQGEISKQFGGSPAKAAGAEVRELRSVAGPAVAVEVSSVSVADPATLTNMAQPLATAILRGIQVYRPRTAQGGS